VRGLPKAVSVNTRLAVLLPLEVGLNVTLTVHCVAVACVPAQVVVLLNSLAFVPVMVIPSVTVEPLLLEYVTT
jgi:hypothetical protein